MTRRTPLFVLIAAFALGPAASSQEEGGSIREIEVREVLAACREQPISRIWELSERLAGMGAPAKRAIQQGIQDAGVEGKLCGLRALIALDSPTYAADRLVDLASDEAVSEPHRIAAIELIGLTEEPAAEPVLLELLFALDPKVRLASARALWLLGTPGSQRAKDVLREFLKSEDADLRAEGAIALAEIGDGHTPGVVETLRELEREPGLRGQLARALRQKLTLARTLQLREARDEAGEGGASSLWTHLDEIRDLTRRYYDLEEGLSDAEMRARAARGLMDLPGDPHTVFMTPEEYGEFLHGANGVDPSYGGIGAFIDTNVKDRFVILRPIFGGPAWNADIRGGDVVVAVNGHQTEGRDPLDIIKEIKGPAGTSVVLSIYRAGWTEPREITVIRAKIVLPTVFARMLPGDVGYIALAQFAFDTDQEFERELTRLEAEGMRALVIDVRDNPGGLLGTVKNVLSLFLKDGHLIATVKDRARTESHPAAVDGKERTYPVSVLVNGSSASGSELLAGVMQHYSRTAPRGSAEDPYLDAVVFGEPTFGKGTVQNTMPLRSWPGEPFVDEPRKNGRWDPGERYTDLNGNGLWEPGEPFVDTPRRNEAWDEAEPWVDGNGNGTRDEGEPFTDENGDGVWNAAEAFTDTDGDGEYDAGAAVKMTIARYYLPDGSNFTRTRVFKDGGYVYEGGVVPDVAVEREEMKPAHLFELRDLQQRDLFRDYVRSRWKEHEKTFRALAEYDARDPSRYPDFDAFYDALDTRLTKQEVRRAIRIEVRREVANVIGREIVGDLSDDNVLVAGVLDALRRAGGDPAQIEQYRLLQGEPSEAR